MCLASAITYDVHVNPVHVVYAKMPPAFRRTNLSYSYCFLISFTPYNIVVLVILCHRIYIQGDYYNIQHGRHHNLYKSGFSFLETF